MTKKFTFYPQGVCSMMIEIELDGDIIKDVVFTGGCNGNLSGISKLITGMRAEDVIERLEGTRCGMNEYLLRNLYAGQEATVRTGHGAMDWFQTGKGVSRLYIATLLI